MSKTNHLLLDLPSRPVPGSKVVPYSWEHLIQLSVFAHETTTHLVRCAKDIITTLHKVNKDVIKQSELELRINNFKKCLSEQLEVLRKNDLEIFCLTDELCGVRSKKRHNLYHDSYHEATNKIQEAMIKIGMVNGLLNDSLIGR